MKQSSPALPIRPIGLMSFLAILGNVSAYSLRWKKQTKKTPTYMPTIQKQAHMVFKSDYASIFYHQLYRSPRNTIPQHDIFIYFAHGAIVWQPIKISFNVSRTPRNRKTSLSLSFTSDNINDITSIARHCHAFFFPSFFLRCPQSC